MTLEIVSATSIRKDTVVLRDLYWKAGIREYWLVDARGERLEFDIFERGRHGYTAVRRQHGWVKSSILGKSFRLTRANDPAGNPEYTLALKNLP